MKVNDKILCNNSNESNIKDEFYKILDIKENEITVTIEKNRYINGIQVISRGYFIHTKIEMWSKFDDHFSLKYSRKLKLLKLKKYESQR